jgi:hypothetical protein
MRRVAPAEHDLSVLRANLRARPFFEMSHTDLFVTQNLLRSVLKSYWPAHAKRLPIGLDQVAVSDKYGSWASAGPPQGAAPPPQ